MAVLNESLIQRFVRDRGHYLGFLRILCREDELAEDLFQELSVVVIEKINAFDTSRDFGAWVRGIARNLFLKACQNQRRKAVSETAYDPALIESIMSVYDTRNAVEEEEARERVIRLRSCVEKLPENLQQLLRERYESNSSSKRLAQIHQRSVSAIETSLSRLRTSLLDCVQRKARVSP